MSVNAKDDLSKQGFCIVPNVLCKSKLNYYSNLVNEIATFEKESSQAWHSHGNQRIFGLLSKDYHFLELISNSVAIEFADYLLGKHKLLSSITANIALPNNTLQQLHADQGYLPPPWHYPATINVIWLLDDFTKENGATMVCPGTHLADHNGINPSSICAKAGSIICLDGRVWHGSGKNMTKSHSRRAIFCYYCAPFIRQQENFTRHLSKELVSKLNNEQRELLGYHIWEGLGAVNGLPVCWMDGRPRRGLTNEDGIFNANPMTNNL